MENEICLNLHNIGIIKQVIYRVVFVGACFDLEKVKENICSRARIEKNTLKVAFHYGHLQLTKFGYLTLYVTQYILFAIKNIRAIAAVIVEALEEFAGGVYDDKLDIPLTTTNINCVCRIEKNNKEVLLHKLFEESARKQFSVKVFVRTSHCTETPFIIQQNYYFDQNLYYKLKIKNAFLVLYPSGYISIISKTFADLQFILDCV
jgi:hypothetical protein